MEAPSKYTYAGGRQDPASNKYVKENSMTIRQIMAQDGKDHVDRYLNSKKKLIQIDEYTIRQSPNDPLKATIVLNKKQIAEIRKAEDFNFDLLEDKGGIKWIISNNVAGEFFPFSLSIRKWDGNLESPIQGEEIMTIRNHMFKYNGQFYMFTNHPEGRAWNEYLSGPRFICKLEKFPHTDLADVNQETKHELGRFRGVPVGEAIGLGVSDYGHKVRVWKELREIGLFIAASSYLIYSTA